MLVVSVFNVSTGVILRWLRVSITIGVTVMTIRHMATNYSSRTIRWFSLVILLSGLS